MNRQVIAALAVIATMAITAAANARISPEEAQKLPLPELATKVLGDAGTLMVDVNRPRWPGPFGLPGNPPVNEISFYQRPSEAYAGKGWQGLCQSEVVDVSFDGDGVPRHITTHYVFGVADRMERASDQGPAKLDKTEARCVALTPKTSFFYAKNYEEAGITAILLEELRRSRKVRGGWPFEFSCRDQFGGDCRSENPADVADAYLKRGGWETEATCNPSSGKREETG